MSPYNINPVKKINDHFPLPPQGSFGRDAGLKRCKSTDNSDNLRPFNKIQLKPNYKGIFSSVTTPMIARPLQTTNLSLRADALLSSLFAYLRYHLPDHVCTLSCRIKQWLLFDVSNNNRAITTADRENVARGEETAASVLHNYSFNTGYLS